MLGYLDELQERFLPGAIRLCKTTLTVKAELK